MSANEKIEGLVNEISNLRKDAIRLRIKVVEVSNATDWLGTKYERDWLFKAEALIQEAIYSLANTENAIENVRASWAKKEGKK